MMPIVFFSGRVIWGSSSPWCEQDSFPLQFHFFHGPVKKQNLKLYNISSCFSKLPKENLKDIAEDDDFLVHLSDSQ